MKNKKIIEVAIVFLSLIYICLFYYYMRYYGPDNNVQLKNNIANTNVTVDKVLNFIKEYKIDYLDNINNSFTVKDISNQNKLRYVYSAIKNDVDFTNGVSYTKFNNYLQDVFGSTITLKNENILNNEKDIILVYNDVNEVYKYDQYNKPYNFIYSIYNHVVDFKIENNQYILTVNKLFMNDNIVFASIEDAKNKDNILFYIDYNQEDKYTYIKNYISKNYSSIKDQLYIYKYYFTKEKGKLILFKYEKISKVSNNK